MHLWLTIQTCIIEEEKKQNIYVYIIYIFIIIDLKQKKWLLLSEEAFEFAFMEETDFFRLGQTQFSNKHFNLFLTSKAHGILLIFANYFWCDEII